MDEGETLGDFWRGLLLNQVIVFVKSQWEEVSLQT